MNSARAWSRIDWLLLAGVTLFGGLLRLHNLAHPKGLIFDEVYYAQDACWYVHHDKALCGIGAEASAMHPPLAKWLTGGGIELFGYNALGWRVAAWIAGTVTIAALYILARRLLGSSAAATVASGLLAVDFLHFVQSRVAMLDVFVTAFCVLAVLFAVLYRDHALGAGRWWLAAAGLAIGAATASKWSGALIGVAVVGLVLAWDRPHLRRELPATVGLLVGLPVVVYCVTYVGVIHPQWLTWPWAPHAFPRMFARRQRFMLDFQAGLGGTHPYESPAWSWLLDRRPVVFYFNHSANEVREILALGNPLVWLPGVAAVLWQALVWLRSRSAHHPAAVIVTCAAVTTLPWLVLTHGREFVFLYYILPAVPFLCLALGAAVPGLLTRRVGKLALAALVVAAVGGFAFYYPVLTGRTLSYDSWHSRLLFTTCSVRGGGSAAQTVHVDGEVRTYPRPGPGPPPRGWCWI